jgi:hypothetical protein
MSQLAQQDLRGDRVHIGAEDVERHAGRCEKGQRGQDAVDLVILVPEEKENLAVAVLEDLLLQIGARRDGLLLIQEVPPEGVVPSSRTIVAAAPDGALSAFASRLHRYLFGCKDGERTES